MKIIVFNGPPGCGKDEGVLTLVKDKGVIPFSFKRSLKAITLAIYGVSEAKWDSWYSREGKELKRPELNGLSCRQALIKVSEEVIKPAYGDSFFGESESKYLKNISTSNSYSSAGACSDGGFNSEVIPLVEAFGAENVFIVRIFREGCTYEGDSRNWIDTDAILDNHYITIFNDGTLEEFKENIIDVYEYIMKQ